MKPQDEGREEFVRRAGQLYDELVSRAGPASADTFDDIEEQAEKAGGELIRELLAGRLAADEHTGPQIISCPQCGRRMRRPTVPAARDLETFSGLVRYERRHAICDHCGFSFSPAGLPVADPTQGGIEPPPEEDL